MTDVVLQLRGLTITASEEAVRDFLVCLTGQRLVVLERAGARRVESAIAKPATLDDVARKHAADPVRIAETMRETVIQLPPEQYLAPPVRRPPAASPIMQHVRGEEAPRAWAPAVDRAPVFPAPDAATADPKPVLPTVFIKAGRKRGPKPGTVRVQPGQLSRPGNSVRGADVDEPREERTRETSIADRIVRAFELDERQPLPELAAALFGEQTGRAVVKLKLAIERLITQRRLVRTGAASFRPVREAGTDDEDERDSDDQDDEASSFDSSEERPTNLDDEVLSELGIGLG